MKVFEISMIKIDETETIEYFLYGDETAKEPEQEQIEYILTHIKDETSRKIFRDRLQYSLTKDNFYLADIVKTTAAGEKLYEKLKCEKRKIYLYGAGKRGRRFAQMFSDINIVSFVDRDKYGALCGMPVVLLKDFLEQYEDGKCLIFITCADSHKRVKASLINLGISQADIDSIDDWNAIAAKDIYTQERCISGKDRITVGFVDVGAFDGDSVEQFINWSKNPDASVLALEPEVGNYQKCCQNLSKYSNCRVINAAAGEKTETGYISQGGIEAALLTLTGDDYEGSSSKTQIVALDECCKGFDVKYIKMDVEGFEAQALTGAKMIISKERPCLAISVYHKREDIWRLPLQVLSYNPDYKLAFGHYTVGLADTVMYATL